jgi:hypothetical protein
MSETDKRKFRSESEEANWWASPMGRKYARLMFDRALKEGTLIHDGLPNIQPTNPKVLE